MAGSLFRLENADWELSTCESIRGVGEAEYRRLAGPDAPAFLSFDWLDALEKTGCVSAEWGWAPLHLCLRSGGRILAVAPAYLKSHSDGEFVFDHAWAHFAEARLCIAYYPKLVLGVPFTPATGPRILIAPHSERTVVLSAFARGLKELTRRLGLSGAHVLFPPGSEATELAEHGFLLRHGLQFHWRNAGYGSFEDFLKRFSSKRRNQIRRERREMQQQNVEIRSYTGRDIGIEQVDAMYEFYRSTVDKYVWGRRYLNRAFFRDVAERIPERLQIVLAFVRGSSRALGGAFNLFGKDTLYGRYWGARQELPFLHFNVCFYHAIEDCIVRKITSFEPGAGGEHKLARGFEPSLTHSAHHLVDPRLSLVVDDFLVRERRAHLEYIQGCRKDSVLRAL